MAIDYAREFAAIGKKIEARWRKAALHPSAFPEIANDAARAVGAVDVDALLLEEYPRLDLAYRFSDYDIHIFATDRFRIEILYWVKSSTAIHQHAFSGAFKLLKGRSVHVEYAFDVRHEVAPDMLVGDLAVKKSEVMEPGDVRVIEGGNRFIHANYHMTRPTVTMVIRTINEFHLTPQLSYRYPHFAMHTFGSEARRSREHGLVSLVARTGDFKLLAKVFEKLWPSPTLEEMLELLEMPWVAGDDERRKAMLARAAKLFPDYARDIEVTMREERRRQSAETMRARLANSDQKLLFALLVNLSSRERILDHLAIEFPKERPAAAAARLIAASSERAGLPPVQKKHFLDLALVIEGKRKPKDVPALAGLFAADALSPLFS